VCRGRGAKRHGLSTCVSRSARPVPLCVDVPWLLLCHAGWRLGHSM
jgi:hypothetical protein